MINKFVVNGKVFLANETIFPKRGGDLEKIAIEFF